MVDTTSINLLSLCQGDTKLKRVAGTNGGEWAGPCPVCGGVDRLRVWPNHPVKPEFWCRGCGKRGDAIEYVMWTRGYDFIQALDFLRMELPKRERTQRQQPRTDGTAALKLEPAIHPDPQPATATDWQHEARAFCERCEDRLWGKEGRGALEYLMRERHLSDITIAAAGLGLNPTNYRAQWGNVEVKLPRGIVIPWQFDNFYWNVRIRRPNGDLTEKYPQKYIGAKGAINALYRFQTVRPGYPAVMVEGEFDALLLRQIAADHGLAVAVVATGSTTWSRRMDWIIRLALASQVYVAFDRETDAKLIDSTETAAHWWIAALKPKARRLLPTQHDITDMVVAGDSVALWLADALSERVGP